MTRGIALMVAQLLLFPLAVSGQDQGVLIKEGFVTGNHYQQLPEVQQHAYLMGLTDGILVSPLLGVSRDEEGLTWFERCDAHKNSGQLQAIVDRFLQDHPERWHEGMGVLFFLAMKEACAHALGSELDIEQDPSTGANPVR